LMKKSKLNIHARVSFDGECVRVFLSGNDERKLTRNGGELITAIEHVTRLYLLRKIMMPEHIRLSIKCRESRNRDEDLIRLVGRMKKKVIETQQPVTLRPLNAAERRLVHQHLSSDDMVTTTSIGEGRLKQIEISLNTVQ